MSNTFQPIVPMPTTAVMSLVPKSVPVPSPAAAPLPRFAGEPLYWMVVNGATTIQAFARASVRVFSGLGPIAALNGGPWTLYEISPLPGIDYADFFALPGGLPVQYVLIPGATTIIPPDYSVSAGDVIISAASPAWFAVAFQDRVSRDPALWSHEIAVASPSSTAWPAFDAAMSSFQLPNLRLVDHVGHPLTLPSGNALTIGGQAVDDGDSALPLTSTPLAFPPEVIAAGVQTLAGGLGDPYTLGSGERYLQLFDANAWFAQPPASSALARWRRDSHIEPIIDGTPYFRRLVTDLRSAKNGGSAWLAGWIFEKAALEDTTKTWPLDPADHDTDIVKLIKELNDNSTQVRMLATKFVQIEAADANMTLIPLVVLASSALIMSFGFMSQSIVDPALLGLVVTAATGAVLTIADPNIFWNLIRDAEEKSKDTIDAINAVAPNVAVFSANPMKIEDNPLYPGGLFFNQIHVAALKNVGSYHQKLVVIKPPSGDPFGYLGGIDINSDRIDTPLHRALAPFHDVQIRVTGPAVTDMAKTFAERYERETSTSTPPLAVPPAGKHLVQIARTYPRFPNFPGPLQFAPQGEALIRETLGNAVVAARDFIYIENQYFAPDDDFVQLLIDAGDRGVRALLITLPTGTDELFGDIRRNSVFGALTSHWGSRMRVGVPVRRFLDRRPKITANEGRCLLADYLAEGAQQIHLEPELRVPDPPFWAFVDNELIYCESLVASPPTQSGKWMNIRRSDGKWSVPVGAPVDAATPKWGVERASHMKGAPVLAVEVPGIYVHAKVMIVDDTFVSVGSTNIARRSFFHDGEINAFAVSQRLSRDPDNPARGLRCMLWAEHLGLPPELGFTLLADPHGALDYFDRDWYDGCRWQRLYPQTPERPSSALVLPNYDARIKTQGGALFWALLNATPGVLEEVYRKTIWNAVIDPTTTVDPHVTRGPEYPGS